MMYVIDEASRLLDEAAHAAWRHERWDHFRSGLTNMLGNVHMQWENPSLAWTIRHLLELTKNMSGDELMRLWNAGELPTEIRNFITTCHKADRIFEGKQKT